MNDNHHDNEKQSEAEEALLDEAEMIRLLEAGLKDFEQGRVHTQQEVRARLEQQKAKGRNRELALDDFKEDME